MRLGMRRFGLLFDNWDRSNRGHRSLDTNSTGLLTINFLTNTTHNHVGFIFLVAIRAKPFGDLRVSTCTYNPSTFTPSNRRTVHLTTIKAVFASLWIQVLAV